MKYTKLLSLLFVVALFATFTSKPAYAVACSAQAGSTVTVSSSCTFSGTKDGVDAGSGNTNTGIISITSGATLTVGAGQTIAYGSITKGAGGGSIIKTGGGVLLKGGIWYTDADTDGYAASTTPVIQTTAPASGRHRNAMTNVATADCNDADAAKYQNLTGYGGPSGGSDSDGDGYYNGSLQSNICSGASLPAGYSSSQDCYDSNASAKPGQTLIFNVTRGDGSWDYDCDGATTKILSKNGNIGCTDAGSGFCGPDAFIDANYACASTPTVTGGSCQFRGTVCCR
jgi:hypothetical protein